MPRRCLAPVLVTLALLPVLLVAGCGKKNNPTGTAGAAPELASTLGNGGTYKHAFSAVGLYPYHCNIHSTMRGEVIVSATAPASALHTNVVITGSAFVAASVTIPVGGDVTWTNTDAFNHTVSSD